MAEARAGPVMPPPIQQKIDAQLAALWPQIEAEQQRVYAAHQRYWQGLVTHQTALPADGADVLPDVGDLTPTDQPEPWPPVLIADPIACALTVDVYHSPQGWGYVLTATVNITPTDAPPPQAHVRWRRALAIGPDAAALTHAWEPYQPLFADAA